MDWAGIRFGERDQMTKFYAIVEKGQPMGLFNLVRFATRAEAKAELLRITNEGLEGLIIVTVWR